MYHVAAYFVLAAHVSFLVFVLTGGLLLYRWPSLAWLHLLAFLYAVVIQIAGFRCILTDLEKSLLRLAGQVPYSGECLPNYLWSRVGLTGSEPLVVVGFIAFVIAVNARAYASWAAA